MGQLAIEVMYGPMDGLSCQLKGERISIGRKNGNHFKPYIDRSISRVHAEIILEGPNWCLRDLRSQSDIRAKGDMWLEANQLRSESVYPIKENDVFLIGNTIIEVFQTQQSSKVDITDECYKDPRIMYPMDQNLHSVWDHILTNHRGFCDTNFLFNVITANEKNNSYVSVSRIRSTYPWECIANWLKFEHDSEAFDHLDELMIISPRVWRILDIAKVQCNKEMTIKDIISAICYEGRSLAARHILKDDLFMKCFINGEIDDVGKKGDTSNEITQKFINVETTKKHQIEQMSPQEEVGNNDINVMAIYQNRLLKINDIIHLFFKDILLKQHFVSDSEELKKLIKDGDQQKLSMYFDRLENSIMALITGYEKSFELFHSEICSTINNTLEEVIHNVPLGLFSGNRAKELEKMKKKVVETIENSQYIADDIKKDCICSLIEKN